MAAPRFPAPITGDTPFPAPRAASARVQPDDLGDAYSITRELGRGGMGVVYLATERATGRSVAVKVIRARYLDDPDAIARFEREARLVARLSHPGIVATHEARALSDGTLALVMEYVPGCTLKEELQRTGALTVERAERVLREVAGALSHAHALGVVHRDVKPENIFLASDDGRAMLSDFGIARTLEGDTLLTRTGVAIGTPSYMSPEQIDGGPVDGRSDLYSLGLVGWEMLTGRRPWAGEGLYSVLYRQKHEALPSLAVERPDTPARLLLALEGALTKDAAHRWASAEEMMEQLAGRTPERLLAARAGGTAADTEENAPTLPYVAHPAPRAAQGRRVAAVTSILAVVVAMGGWLLTRYPVPRAPTPVSHTDAPPTAPMMRDAAERIPLSGRAGERRAIALANSRGAADAPVTKSAPAAVEGAAASGVPGGGAGAPAAIAPPDARERSVASSVPISSGAPAASTPEQGAAISRAAAPSAPGRAEGRPPGDPAAGAGAVAAASSSAALSAGGTHSCMLRSGAAYCWGGNGSGELGDGSTTRRATPARVANLSVPLAEIAAGLSHTCAVSTDGTAYCWGRNDRGQLGDGTFTSRATPVRVARALRFREVRAGSWHSCGITRSGEAWCWGANDAGQLGAAVGPSSVVPVRVVGGLRTIATGWRHSCAVTEAGTVLCWGANGSGQLGNGGTAMARSPVQVRSDLRFAQVTAGSAHSCALTSAGEAWCWGRNDSGQLGDGTTMDRTAPVRVATERRFISIVAGSMHSCGLTREGEAYCWGGNSYGQLGAGGGGNRTVPERVSAARFAALTASGAHTCGVATSGARMCWGYNVDGQLGDGSRSDRWSPVQVEEPAG